MKLAVLLPSPPTLRDTEAEKVVEYLKKDAPMPAPVLGAVAGKTIQESIDAFKSSAETFKDKMLDEKNFFKRVNILKNGVFVAARYRDVKYAAANRKYLFGLGFHQAMVNSARTIFAAGQVENNAE
jgi:hypothetical protein